MTDLLVGATVTLRKMTAEEYKKYSQFSFDSFVEQAAAASGEAVEDVRKRVGAPPTEPSTNDLWYLAEHRGSPFGFLWIQILPEGDEAFGYEIYLEEAVRGKGLGRQIMVEGRKLLQSLGIRKLRACVFSDNITARRLYQSLGFKEISYRATKKQYELEVDV